MKTNANLKIVSIIIIIVIVFLISSFIKHYTQEKNITGNKEILTEINRLLGPLEARNMSEKDFVHLQALVEGNNNGEHEVEELVTLATYQEYPHIGHGLGFLYEYVKTGEEPICPGHLLSHYYVFMNHNEEHLAEENFEEAQEQLTEWNTRMLTHNETYLQDKNYTYYKEFFEETILSIENGNSTVNKEYISELANAPCGREI